MDPNNNQPISTPINTKLDQQPAGSPLQPSPIPVSAPAQQPTPASALNPEAVTVSPGPVPQVPKSGGKKVTILLVILLVLVLGIVVYIIFANNQLNTASKSAGENTSTVIPTATIAPTLTPATADEINVASPDADLKDIEADLQGL